MKVLFNAHPAAFQKDIFGGSEVQLLKTKEYLEKLGVSVKGFDTFNDKLEDYKVFHNFGMNRDTLMLYTAAKKEGLKIALSSIYWPPSEMVFSDEGIEGLGKLIFEKLAMFKSNSNPFFRVYPYLSFLEKADIILPNSKTEGLILQKRFGISSKKIFPVPNGVDKKYLKSNSVAFYKKYNLKDFVLFVGRIEPRKNLIRLIRSCKELNLPLVIVGHTSHLHLDYFKKCKEEAKSAKVYFLGSFPKDSKLLMSAYASAKVLALPSWYETPGLVALEAGLTGANIAITDRGSTKDYFGSLAEYCNPKRKSSIKDAIRKAYSKEKNTKLQKHILNNFTWEKVAKKTLEAYKKIIK